MRTLCLAVALFLSAMPCIASCGELEPPRPGIRLGQILPGGTFQPGLTGTLDMGKYTSLSVGVGQSAGATNEQRFEPAGTVGLTVRF